MKKSCALLIVATLVLAGCAGANKTQKGAGWGAGIGAAVGAGIGYAIGGKKGAAWGAGAGLVAGGLTGAAIGSYMDKQEEELVDLAKQGKAFSVQRNNNNLEVNFKSDRMFEQASPVIKTNAYQEIDRVCAVLNKYPQCTIRIEGHTDSTGSEAFNQKLSSQRAAAIKAACANRSVDPSRIEVVGRGEGMPIAGNDTAQGRHLNRRVTMTIIPIEAQS